MVVVQLKRKNFFSTDGDRWSQVVSGVECVALVVFSASQSEEEGVAALGAVHRIILIIEVQDVLLRFETKLLIQQHGGITGRHVQRHVLPHTRLKNTDSTAAQRLPVRRLRNMNSVFL